METTIEQTSAVLELPELTTIQEFRTELAAFMGKPLEDRVKEVLEEVEGLTVAGHTEGPKAGREACHRGYMKLVRLRTQEITEPKEKFKAPVLSIGGQIDARFREFIAWIKPHEDRLKKERDDWDAAEARRISEERAEVARQRKAKLQARTDELQRRGISVDLKAIELVDGEWDTWLQAQTDALAVRRRAQEIAEELTSLGDTCLYGEVLAMTEEEMVQRLEAAKLRQVEDNRVLQLADDLSELGDECTIGEARALTIEEAEFRLGRARRDKAARDEADRIKLGKLRYSDVIDMDPELLLDGRPMLTAEELAALDLPAWNAHIAAVTREAEERGRRRLQLGADRLRTLSELGMESLPTMDQLSFLTQESFDKIRSLAVDAKATRDERARLDREELETSRREKEARGKSRAKAIDDAGKSAPVGTKLQSWSEDYLATLPEAAFQELLEDVRQETEAAREAARIRQETADRETQEREDRLRPERERLAAWARAMQSAIPAIPDVSDPQLMSLLSRTTTTIETALRLMRGALEGNVPC